MGYNILATAYEYLNYPLSGIGANVKTIRQNAGQVKRVIKSLIRAARWRKETKPLKFGRMGQDSPNTPTRLTMPPRRSSAMTGVFQEMASSCSSAWHEKDAKINREVPIGEVADFSLLREVQKDLGLR